MNAHNMNGLPVTLPVILVTGKNGQLGFALQRSLAPLARVVAVDVADCDLSNEKAIRALMLNIKPDIVINPAAYTAVDKAEKEPELAHAINAKAPQIFAEEAEKIGALIVHYSTDYVFDGTKTSPYHENDLPNPQNVYGQTKWQGEQAVARSATRHLIFRTSWVVGTHGGNFAKTMLKLAMERDNLSVVADQWGAPTTADLLADTTAHLVCQYWRDKVLPYGLYHVVAGGKTNWHEYAVFVIQSAINAGLSLKVQPADIKPIPSTDYPTPAKRPMNSCLDSKKFSAHFGLMLPDWQNSLLHTLQQILVNITLGVPKPPIK